MIVDKFGHCIWCGENMITEKLIDGKIQQITKSNYSCMKFELDDTTKMRVGKMDKPPFQSMKLHSIEVTHLS